MLCSYTLIQCLGNVVFRDCGLPDFYQSQFYFFPGVTSLVFISSFSDPLLPAAEITEIPKDGNLRHFSVQQMVTIFRLLNVREDIVHRLFNSNIDGKRFSLFTDKDLKTLGVLNPIVTYFRDRSIASAKKPPQFML